ncbi:MAG: hypothetical protein ACUVSY_06170 [Roseiflexus sp.]
MKMPMNAPDTPATNALEDLADTHLDLIRMRRKADSDALLIGYVGRGT